MAPDGDSQAAGYETLFVRLLPSVQPGEKDGIARQIALTRGAPTLKVGRSSKTVSKGLVPAVDNAYFDSPVVSRAHAEITGNFEDGTITITDTGSLHGTSVNDKVLEKGVATPLQQDDRLSFGIHVSRGLDVFYPTVCSVLLERTSVKPAERARSYCAPGSDDGLSDEGSEAGASEDECRGVAPENTEACGAFVLGDATLDLDADETSDYGEVELDDEDGEGSDTGSSDSGEMGSFNSEDEDGDEDEEEEEEEETHEDKDGDFLDQELKALGLRPPSSSPAKETASSSAGSSPGNNPWTPPPTAGEEAAVPVSEDSDKGDECDCQCGHDEDAPVEDENVVVVGDNNDDAEPKGAARFSISTILNPAGPETTETTDPVCGHQLFGAPAAAWETTPAAPEPQTRMPLSPIAADIVARVDAAEQAVSAERFPGVSAAHPGWPSMASMALDSAAEWAAAADEPDWNAVRATLLPEPRAKNDASNKKRKAADMLEDETPLAETSGNAGAGDVPAQPAAKRPATAAAKAKAKSILRAAAETIGIAALGGAVVLGSLIYTAPSF